MVQHQFFEQSKQPHRIEMNKEIGDTYIQMWILLLHSLEKDKNSTCHRIGIFGAEVFQRRSLCLKKQHTQSDAVPGNQINILLHRCLLKI